jgi:hypothetical protein
MPPSRALAQVLAAAALAAPPFAFGQALPESTLQIAGAGVSPAQVTVWRQPPDGVAEPAAVIEADTIKPGVLAVRVACDAGDFVVKSSSQVSWPFRIEPEWCGRTREVVLAPLATVRGRVVLPVEPAQPAVDQAAASGQAGLLVALPLGECADDGAGREIGRLRVRAGADGRFSATIPAGCVQLGLRVSPFAPIPAARVEVHAGEARDLGNVLLQRGATVGVRVRYRGAPSPGVSVFVVPADEYTDALDRLVSARAANVGAMGTTDRAGRTTFVGVLQSAVRLVAVSLDRLGMAGPVELSEGEETDADDVELRGAATVTFAITGDASWTSDVLRVVGFAPLTGADPSDRPSFSANVAGTTGNSYPLLLPGRWRFELRAGEILIDRQEVEAVPETAMAIQLSAERRRFRGRVFIGDEPAAGSLTLAAGGTGEPAARLDTNAEGRFTAALPEPGPYTVLFSRAEDGIRDARATAEFALDRETVIRFAATRVEGTVDFADGRPAAGAVVEVDRTAAPTDEDVTVAAGRLRSVTADRNGRFVIRSLERGDYELTARLGARKSGTQAVSVGDGPAPSVQLVMPDADGLTVRLLDALGGALPLVSGWVMAPATSSGGLPQATSFQTDAEGTARIGVSLPTGSAVHVVVTDPNYPVTAFRATPADDGGLALTVPPAGGLLSVVRPRGATGADAGALVLAREGGAMVPLSLLLETGFASETRTRDATVLVIRALSTGEWHLGQFADTRAMLLAYSGGGAPTLLRSFSVSPGTVVSVDLR